MKPIRLGIPTMSTSASYNTRTNYKKHLYLYELEHCDFNERRPPEMEPKFDIGEFVRIVSSNYEGQVFYAKVVKCRWRQNKNMYYVHYNGWSNSHDEWMPEGVLAKLLREEVEDAENLANPHPNRSSKSNYIIGEPAHPSEHHHRSGKGSKKASRSGSETDDDDGDDDDDEVFSRTYSSPEKTLAGGKSLRLKLRARIERGSGGDASNKNLRQGPNLEKIQQELEKLEDEKFLEHERSGKPVFLSIDNLHSFNLGHPLAGPFKQKLLETVDLRVPNLEYLVGQPPLSKSTKAKPATQQDSEKANDQADRRENIKTLERELLAIKKEYRRKKQLLQLYYGSSESSNGESSTSSEGSSTGRSKMLSTPRRGARINRF